MSLAEERDRSRTRNPGKAQRVEAIAQSMEDGTWTGTRNEEWAELFGVTAQTIVHDAGEAARLLKRAITDDDVRAWADAHLAQLKELAQDDRDYSNARGAIRDRLDARGLLVSRQMVRHEIVQRSEEELFVMFIEQVKKDEALRQRAMAMLASVDVPALGVGE